MKNTYFLNLIILFLLFSGASFAQQINKGNNEIGFLKTDIVKKLNTPSKIWINGGWEIKNDGNRVWKKGHWEFEEKTFQQKSEIFRSKMNEKNRV